MKSVFYLFLTILLFSCGGTESSTQDIPSSDAEIRINQLGYYPDRAKVIVVTGTEEESFSIVNQAGEVVFSAMLGDAQRWEASGETVRQGDFSELTLPGNYVVRVGDTDSYPFEVKEDLYREALNASLKSYYFQRASMAVTPEFGGEYARAAGHPDDSCIYHVSTGRQGTMASPGGWYDAGDYGKYIVNAALSVGQMLNLLEMKGDVVGDAINIPESGNGVDDLADELKYELDWMLTMQDDDGGVFHKLTSLGFSGFIMPEDFDLDRYVIGKSTSATLSFAAVMAQASRVFRGIDPMWSDKALAAAKRAYAWGLENPSEAFTNPEDVSTGQYDDDRFTDDFYWAATELSLATGDSVYDPLTYEQPVWHEITNSWRHFVRNVAFHSTLINEPDGELRSGMLALADSIQGVVESHPYAIGLSHFEWGSNSDILNQAMILCMAHYLTGDDAYLNGAVMITDYIFGKNATGYCFLTGFGAKQVMNVHHRPSGADGIEAPVPGFIAGGPNKDQQDKSQVEYLSDLPAKSFEDVEPSFASNEVCINWNAPAVFVLGYLSSGQ